MPYRHYGNIGDVWKHLPLCEVLAIEQPTTYVETNAAYAAYTLTGTPRQRYGVGQLYAHSDRSEAIAGSRYLTLLRAVNGEAPTPRTYLGSPALAMQVLKDRAERFVFFDLEAPALANDVAYAGALDLTGRVETVVGDSIAGTLALLPDLDAGTFLHVDPYLIFEPNEAGDTYVDVFLAAAARGLRCILWYGYFTGDERAWLAERIREAVADHPGVDGARLYGAEIAMALMQPDAVIVNPGVVGCSVLTANLSPRSREAIAALSAGLVAVYAEGVRFEGQPGRLVRSEPDF